MEIPYNVELREDTGLYNSKLGIWLFLASEIMLFGGLFSAYILLRTGAPVWPPIGEHGSIIHLLKDTIPHATFNTVILILSSVTMVMAWVSLKQKDLNKYKLYLGTTIVCAIIFCTGLAIFCKRMPNKWLALTVSIPWLVIVFSMNSTRQAAALGLILFGMTLIFDRRYLGYIISILAAALFHTSAIVMLFFGVFGLTDLTIDNSVLNFFAVLTNALVSFGKHEPP